MKLRNYEIKPNWEFIKWTASGIIALIRLWIFVLFVILVPYALGFAIDNYVYQFDLRPVEIIPVVYWFIGLGVLTGLFVGGAWVWSAVVITKQ